MTNTVRPNIYGFKNTVSYLEACFTYEKSQRPDLSLRKWAKFLNLNSSEILLEIIKGKRKASAHLIEALAKNFGLDETEKKYFGVMNQLSESTSASQRMTLELVLSELSQLTGTRLYVEDDSVFSHWVHMAILTMARLKNFNCNKDTIRENLEEDVPQEVINNAVDRLIHLGLVNYDASGSLKRSQNHTTTKNDIFTKSAQPYFMQVSELAKKASSLSPEIREFQCFSLAINNDQIPAFKDAIRNFRGKVANLANVEDSNQVYQMNIQFFPLSIAPSSEVHNLISTIPSSIESDRDIN